MLKLAIGLCRVWEILVSCSSQIRKQNIYELNSASLFSSRFERAILCVMTGVNVSSDVFLANAVLCTCDEPGFSWLPCCHWEGGDLTVFFPK